MEKLMNKFHTPKSSMEEMWELIVELFPIHRTLVNDGFKNSLEIIKRKLDITILEYDSGMEVWDWIIPNAWNVREAYIKDSTGNRIVDFNNNNLHLAPYSAPFSGKLTKSELLKHIWTLPDDPGSIPYRTLYYKTDDWKFCIAHNDLRLFNDSEAYDVCIDIDSKPGKLCIGEYYLPGKTEKEILITSYLCHPSLANDNLSGVAVAVEIMKNLAAIDNRRYSYRLLVVPECIGATTYLATHEDQLHKIVGGYVLTCCGDDGIVTYKKTYSGNSIIDKAAVHVLKNKYQDSSFNEYDFWPNGSDEQKYNAPGVRLDVGSFMRTPYSEFAEYHTSKDNLSFISKEKLFDTLDSILRTLYVIDNDEILNNNYKGEPFLSKHGIYQSTDLKKPDKQSICYIQRVLMMELDGLNSLLDIADKWNYSFDDVYDVSREFLKSGLVRIVESK